MTYEVLVTDDASRDLADICEIIVLLRRSTLDARNHWLRDPAYDLQFTPAHPAVLSRPDHLADYLDSQVKLPPFLCGEKTFLKARPILACRREYNYFHLESPQAEVLFRVRSPLSQFSFGVLMEGTS